MGSYYSGMMNNKDGYGELRHYRTKGSKNGISNTPGYVAVGEKARPHEESRIYLRQNDRNPRNKQSQVFNRSNCDPLQKYKAVYDKVGQVTREYGPKAASYIGNGAREFARNSSEVIKGFSRGGMIIGRGLAKDIGNAGKAVSEYIKNFDKRRKELYEDYKNNPNKYVNPYGNTSSKTELAKAGIKIGGRVIKKIHDTYEDYRHGKPKETNYMRNYWHEVGGLMGTKYEDEDLPKAEQKARRITNENKEENRLRDKFIQAENHMNSTQKEYNDAVSKKDFDAIERLEGKLNRATDRYLRAQNDYQSYRNRPSWKKYK